MVMEVLTAPKFITPFQARSRPRFVVCCTTFQKAPYKQELEAAIDVVARACRLSTLVHTSTISKGEGKQRKSDHSPVTVADFAIQALISMELGILFPSIPLVAEEDARYLQTEFRNTENGTSESTPLLDLVVEAVTTVLTPRIHSFNKQTILDAIDRGGEISNDKTSKNTYWVLDPIDGTRGFLRGGDAFYVIGLALVVDGELVLGVMGCPKITYSDLCSSSVGRQIIRHAASVLEMGVSELDKDGLIMAAHKGYGTWLKPLCFEALDDAIVREEEWIAAQNFARCTVDACSELKNACFCIGDHEEWKSLPLAKAMVSNDSSLTIEQIESVKLLPLCCGSLCKYFAVAMGAASLFLVYRKPKYSVKVWDHAAGVICVVEAGGKVTDVEDTSLDILISKGNRTFIPYGDIILVTNNHLHSNILKLLACEKSAC